MVKLEINRNELSALIYCTTKYTEELEDMIELNYIKDEKHLDNVKKKISINKILLGRLVTKRDSIN